MMCYPHIALLLTAILSSMLIPFLYVKTVSKGLYKSLFVKENAKNVSTIRVTVRLLPMK